MRDRTRELRQGSGRSWRAGEGQEEEEEEGEGVALVGLKAPPPPGDDVLRQAEGVRAALGQLEGALEQLEQQQEALLGTPLPPPGQQQQLQQVQEQIQQLTRDVQHGLRGLEPQQEEEPGTLPHRLRSTQHAVLSRQLLELSSRCHSAQARYRQRSLDRIRRQLHIAGSGSLSEEQLEELLDTGPGAFGASLLVSTRVTRAALEEAETRHRELAKLEKGLRELGELFSLLGTTVHEQGEVLERIERQVQDSGWRLRKGGQQLRAARRSQRGARQKRLLLVGCLLVTLTVVVAVVAGTLASG